VETANTHGLKHRLKKKRGIPVVIIPAPQKEAKISINIESSLIVDVNSTIDKIVSDPGFTDSRKSVNRGVPTNNIDKHTRRPHMFPSDFCYASFSKSISLECIRRMKRPRVSDRAYKLFRDIVEKKMRMIESINFDLLFVSKFSLY
jgi:hypothetical protein